MSADNWAICPKCLDAAMVEFWAKGRKVAEGYGKLPLDEFDTLRGEVAMGVDEEDFRTFREDYEQHVLPDGRYYVSYGGGCEKCGLSHTFEHEDRVFTPTPADNESHA